MKPFPCIILCTLLISTGSAFFDDPSWDTLRTTWGVQIWKSSIFQKMPLTKSEAENEGYSKLPTSTSCAGTFLGYRYAKPGDTSIVMLYDGNGYLVGIQSGFPKHLIRPTELETWFQNSRMLLDDDINGNATYTTTAYFVDPAIICNGGRTAEDVVAHPIGTELSFQTKGSNPTTDLIKIPREETEVQNGTAWTKGECFRTMGVHYWYNVTSNMNCDNFLPAFLLYNRGILTGFGWAVTNMFTFSDKYEHPPKSSFNKFFSDVPQCLNDKYDTANGFTTMHVYMNVKPWNMIC